MSNTFIANGNHSAFAGMGLQGKDITVEVTGDKVTASCDGAMLNVSNRLRATLLYWAAQIVTVNAVAC